MLPVPLEKRINSKETLESASILQRKQSEMFSRFSGEGSESPNGSNINSRAASFIKMALNQAQQFANGAMEDRTKQDQTKMITDELSRSDKVLHTLTPDPDTMTQPTDDDEETANSESNESKGTVEGENKETQEDGSKKEGSEALDTARVQSPSLEIVSGVDISKLSPDLRGKIKKFAKYEEKYPKLLDAYKTEREKTLLIAKFERLLLDHTPCSRISESEALFHYFDDLKLKNDIIGKQLVEAQNKSSQLEQDNNKYKVIVKNLQRNDAKLRELEEANNTKDKEIESLKLKAKELEDSLSLSNSEIESLKSKEQDLQKMISENNDSKGHDEELESLKSQLSKFQDLETELNTKSSKIEELEKELESLQNGVEAKVQSDPKPTEAPLSKSAKKKQKKKNAKSLQQKPDAIKETETVVEDTKQQKPDFNEQLAAKDALVEEAELKFKKACEEIKDLKTELTDSKEEVENLKDSLKNIGDELVTLKNGEMNDEKALHMQHTELITSYERNIKTLHDDIVKLESQLDSLKQANEVLTNEKQLLKAQNESLQKVKDSDIDLKLEINNLKKSLETKEKSYQEATSRIKYIEEEKNSVNDKLVELKVTLENSKNQLKSSSEHGNKLMTENENLKEEMKKYELRIGKLNNENSILLKNRDEFKDKLSDLTHLKTNNSDQVNNLSRVNDELNMRMLEQTKTIESLQEELNDSRAMLQERTRETSTIRKLLVELEDEKQKITKEFETKLNQRNDEIEKLNFEITKLNKKFKGELNELTSKLNKYEEELTQKDVGVHESTPMDISPSNVDNTGLLNKQIEMLQKQLQLTDSKLKEYENMNSVLKKLNEDISLKFEKLNKNYRSQQAELKKSKTDSIDLQRRLSSASSTNIPTVNTIVPADTKSDANDDEKVSYIKNVLIGFIEKKEMRPSLLPVMKMLLNLDSSDIEVLTSNLK